MLDESCVRSAPINQAWLHAIIEFHFTFQTKIPTSISTTSYSVTMCKRLIEEVDSPECSIEPASIKRKTEDSSNSDTSYVSAAAAIFSDDSGSEDTAQTDVDSESELSESSEEPSSESDDSSEEESEVEEEETVTNVRAGMKPVIQSPADVNKGLLSRVQSFIPAIEKANRELEKERVAGTLGERDLEGVKDGEGPYIEMVCDA
jgi:hypothetical protein